MNTKPVKKFLISNFIIISLITAGFIGILIVEGMLDNDEWSAHATTTRYVGGTGFGNYSKIQDAIDSANSGDTIRVYEGTYYENLVVNKTISLIGNGSANTTIDGSGTGDVVKIISDWVNITGFKIRNSGPNNSPDFDAGIELYAVENIMVIDNTLLNTQRSIYLASSKKNTIKNNICQSNNIYDIYLSYSNSNTLINNSLQSICNDGIRLYRSHFNNITNNTSNSKSGSGIVIRESNDNVITNNTCIWNTLYGINIWDSELNKIEHNTCSSNHLYGIFLSWSDSNIMENNTCLKNDYGILSDNSNSLVISNNTCSNNFLGIFLDKSHFSRIIKNFCISNYNCGIYFQNSNSGTIENSNCSLNYDDGIHVAYSDSNTIANNSIYLNKDSGISLSESLSITLLDNKMYFCGLEFYGTKPEYWNTHIIDTSNIINNKPIYYWKFRSEGTMPTTAGQCILASCNNIQIEKLSISNANPALALAYSSSNNIENNTFSNNTIGIYLYSSNSNTISNNICSLNRYSGIDIRYSSNNIIDNNTCNKNDYNGIFLLNSDSNSISYNNASLNDFRGISLNSSIINTLFYNNILYNNGYGLFIKNSRKNSIYYNNIVENTVQVVKIGDSQDNQWDNGNGEGNYWSDYGGLDNGYYDRMAGDGIGDTQIPHHGLDEYPFINRSGWLYPARPILVDPGDFDSDGNYLITWLSNRGTIGFILEEDTNLDFNSPKVVYEGSELTFQAKNMQNGTYYYRLKAYSNYNESLWSNVVNITVDWVPHRPQNLSVSIFPFGNALNLSWSLNPVDTKGYNIYYKIDTVWTFLESISYPKHTFNHSGLKDGQEYYYKVEAIDHRGQSSGFSDIVSAIPMDSLAPIPPTGLSIVDNETSYNSIKLVWEPNSEEDVIRYNIYRGNISNTTTWGDLVGTVYSYSDLRFIDSNLDELTEYFYRIKAFDEVPNESDYSAEVSGITLLGPHGPEIQNPIADFEINEDGYDDTTIKLYDWFNDINGDLLTFDCTGNNYIDVTIYQENGTVVLKPEKNWNGNETLTFYATDGEYVIFDNIMITVLPVNDPPLDVEIRSPTDGDSINEDITNKMYFIGFCNDPDSNDDLTYLWSSSIDEILGEGINITDITLSPGKHIITLNVTDRENCSCLAKININVTKVKKSSEDNGGMNWIMMSVIAIVIVILLFLILFLILKRRKEDKRTELEKKPAIDQKYVAPSPGLPLSSKRPFDTTSAQQYAPFSTKPSASKPTLIPKFTLALPSPALIKLDPTKTIEFGKAYIINTKGPGFGLEILEKELLKTHNSGLCITRTHPSKLKKSKIIDDVTKIWLSKTPEKDSVSPGNLTKIAHIINEFLKSHPKGIILLDGLEYLIINNDFPKILKFTETLHEKIVLSKGVLLVPINPSTMQNKNYEILEKELINTIKDPKYFT